MEKEENRSELQISGWGIILIAKTMEQVTKVDDTCNFNKLEIKSRTMNFRK